MSDTLQPKFQHGLVLGKFMPPHHGHRLVINAALRQSAQVTLVISVLPDDKIPASQRASWLRQLYPTTTVAIMLVTWDITDGQAWATGIQQAVGRGIDAVFSSEDYGLQLAKLLHCDHVMVDHHRKSVPISSSRILENPTQYKKYLDPIVWESLGAGKESRTPFISLES